MLETIKFHPGSYIKDIIEELGISLSDFSKLIDVEESKLNLIVRGEKNLDLDTINKLSKFTNTSKHLWFNLQKNYDSK